jgi:hypothetical protein
MAFFWFLRQSIVVGGLGARWFVLGLIIGIAALVWAYRRAEPVPARKLLLLVLLPAVWIFMGLWGDYFWMRWEHTPVIRNPRWVLIVVDAGIWIYLAIAAALILYLREARLFVVTFALLNFYFVLTMTLLASMAVTGDWL